MRLSYLWAVVIALGITVVPALAQSSYLQRETTLNGIAIGATYSQVLAVKGAPHGVGPSLPTVEDVWNALDPPPVETANALVEQMGGASAPELPRQDAARNAIYAQYMPRKNFKSDSDYIAWEYIGGGAKSDRTYGWVQYILFNRSGRVAGIVMYCPGNSERARFVTRTKSNITFLSTLADVTRAYTLPEPIVRYDKGYWPDAINSIEQTYYLTLPEQNVTFTFNSATRKVIAIAVGIPVAFRVFDQTRDPLNAPMLVKPKPAAGQTGIPGTSGVLGVPGVPAGR